MLNNNYSSPFDLSINKLSETPLGLLGTWQMENRERRALDSDSKEMIYGRINAFLSSNIAAGCLPKLVLNLTELKLMCPQRPGQVA